MAVLAAFVLAGCGAGGTPVPRPGSGPLPVEVLAFGPGGHDKAGVVEIGDEPILWPELAGAWDREDDPPADAPDMTYLAAAQTTGCRPPESVRVTRTGPNLTVEFTGGREYETCVAAFSTSALLALRSADLEGVRSVNGEAPAAPTGAGVPTAFVPLGASLGLEESGQVLGLDPLYGQLEAAGATSLPEAKAALEADVPDGFLGLAFVAAGCLNTGAVLVLDDPVTVELTGNAGASCESPEYFLATFEVPAEYVPEGAVPGGN